MTSATANTLCPSRRRTSRRSKLIAAYYRARGTVPTVAAASDGEEAELYRSLKRLRLQTDPGVARAAQPPSRERHRRYRGAPPRR